MSSACSGDCASENVLPVVFAASFELPNSELESSVMVKEMFKLIADRANERRW